MEKKCNNCVFFDINGVDGKPFGIITNISVTRKNLVYLGEVGVCRTGKGLSLGLRYGENNCANPNLFIPRENCQEIPIVSSDSSEQFL